MSQATEGRWGSGGVEIADVDVPERRGPADARLSHRRAVDGAVHGARRDSRCTDFVFGVGIFNAEGVCVYGTNTDIEEYEADSLSRRRRGHAVVIDALDLVEGTYKLDVAVHKRDGAPYDYHRLLYTFRVKSRLKDVGIYRPRHRWEFSPTVTVQAAGLTTP